jgi:hypothetical protein
MKKIITLCTIVFTLLTFSVSASNVGHKYKKPSKSHKIRHHHNHSDPSYTN